MTNLTLIFPYYKNPMMLAYQWNFWRRYSPDVCKKLEIIVVDDGSPVGFRAEELPIWKEPVSFSKQLFRIVVDIPWNQRGAANLGFQKSASEWCAFIDIDHVFTQENLEALLRMDLDKDKIYSLRRISHVTKQERNEPEMRLLSKAKYCELGGFDESFAGHYGFMERDFNHRVKQTTRKVQLPVYLEDVPVDMISDAMTFGLVRKEGRDNAAYRDIKKWKLKNRVGIQTLKFPWKQIL